MACWAAPDLSKPVVTTLDAGLEIQVLDQQEQWAHILCSNGWSAWVDSRLLVTNGTDGVEP
jgi:SH3-like domain-containing protein